MKKETIIAITLGVVLGGAVAVGMVFATQKKESDKVIPVVQNSQITPVMTKQDADISRIEVTEPADQTITDKKTITIKGKAPKESLVVIQSAATNTVLKTDAEEFSSEFTLALGENKITVNVYPKEGNGSVQERELTIYLLEE